MKVAVAIKPYYRGVNLNLCNQEKSCYEISLYYQTLVLKWISTSVTYSKLVVKLTFTIKPYWCGNWSKFVTDRKPSVKQAFTIYFTGVEIDLNFWNR